MKEQAIKYIALHDWFHTPQGIRVAHAFSSELALFSQHLSGEFLLQLGDLGENPWLPMLNFRHKWLVSACTGLGNNTLQASLTMLPIQRDSVDCVVAPLTLEAFRRDRNPIDEIDRILKPMGYAIFFGINPISFWGLALRTGYLKSYGAHAEITLTSSLTLRRMMMHRGYSQCAFTSFYYIPPVKSPFLIRNLAFLNEMGKMVWPFPAAFYCFVVQKYQPCVPSVGVTAFHESQLLRDRESSLQPIGNGIHLKS